MKKKRHSRWLDGAIDVLAASLLFEATGVKVGRGSVPLLDGPENRVPYKERRAFLEVLIELQAERAKTKGNDEEDGIASFREALGGGDSREVERGADTDADENGVQPDSREA